MRKLSNCSLFLAALVFLHSIDVAQAQKPEPAQLNIPYSPLMANIDGELSDEIWQQALIVELDIVNSPWNNLPSPVKTQAQIIENGEYIFIAFIAEDPQPEKIKGFLADRDSRWGDDLVGIKFDTQNNRRLNYEFIVNPLGVQHDSINNEMTGEVNDLWDGIWQSYGKITQRGYQVELAIPYRILNFEENKNNKLWPIELFRIYPRDTQLRISHVPLDRNNACSLCQYPEAKGFKNAAIGKNIQITPAIVASSDQYLDIYDPKAEWQKEDNIDAGIDFRWGMTPNTSLNLTLNPDFSTIESDAGQLNVNKTFSLFYDEKRAFFLDNADYFTSNYNLVDTRNIADPDYGVKLTGKDGNHSYGVFSANDTQTTFIKPGNLSSELMSLAEESLSTALRYRFDYNDDLTIGAISTLRTSDNYHNYVYGLDSKYRVDNSNSILFQALNSDSSNQTLIDNSLNNKEDISDQAYKIDLVHQSEYWNFTAGHQYIGKNFRANLGYMPKADFVESNVQVKRFFYGDHYNDGQSFWSEANISSQWQIQHNIDNQLIAKSINTRVELDGPLLSQFTLVLTHAKKVGLRYDKNISGIDNNTTRFTENQLTFVTKFEPLSYLYSSIEINVGDKIDYQNNRLGEAITLTGNITLNATNHLEFDVYYTYSQLEADSRNVYNANLTDIRISYQFNVNSYLKLNLVYSDIDMNVNNNPLVQVSQTDKYLTSQLIYAYKLNPQTVFFLGYSDGSYQDDDLLSLRKKQKTFFTKISYAWMPQ